ncbi:type II toxin-antitoxin system Phd/YefM family antitoxin [Brucella rhizosphaerae]|uniref:type II toxin-antitoxin system Phd/YefM family antitoxin n=1 Tax=Brucella rhizosphaerae TaxID=571254 RepID=UPI0004638D49|nr:type II toxin-antitoxin system Phd/YefM family antitoxin [Brucella rhizosphaerae]
MQISNFSSRDFNQHVAAAKKAASGDDVVYILDRGKPAHVLMSIEKYRQLSGQKQNILQMLAMPEAADIDLEIERTPDLPRSVDLS